MNVAVQNRLKQLAQEAKLVNGEYRWRNLSWREGNIDEQTATTVMNMMRINGYYLNPPPLSESGIKWIYLSRNQLMILDGLFHQGSIASYEDEQHRNKFSEHSGYLILKDDSIDKIVTFADSSRIDSGDPSIFLPKNQPDMGQYPFLFHTHPITGNVDEQFSRGVLYEFPSPGDLANFAHYSNSCLLYGSIVIAPEGMYVIRKDDFQKKIVTNPGVITKLQREIDAIEKEAIGYYRNKREKLLNRGDYYHLMLGRNVEYIAKYNDLIKSLNLFVEYYPRIKSGDNWVLTRVNLPVPRQVPAMCNN